MFSIFELREQLFFFKLTISLLLNFLKILQWIEYPRSLSTSQKFIKMKGIDKIDWDFQKSPSYEGDFFGEKKNGM